MTVRDLTTFDAVLNAVGGFAALAALIGVSKPLTYRWRDAGRFPAYTLDRIEAAVAPCTVARGLFDFEPARTRKTDHHQQRKPTDGSKQGRARDRA